MRFLILVASVLFSSLVFADDMNCMNKTVAVYSPGPNWSQLQVVIPRHLVFISARMTAGDMEEGGPFLGAQGATGGFMVYNSQDAAAVEKMVKEDPFVAEGVANYEIRVWMKCTPK